MECYLSNYFYDELISGLLFMIMTFFTGPMLANEEKEDIDIVYTETNVPVSRISRPYFSDY